VVKKDLGAKNEYFNFFECINEYFWFFLKNRVLNINKLKEIWKKIRKKA